MLSRFYRCRMCGFVVDIQAGVTLDQAHGHEDSVLPPDPTRQGITDVPVIWQCPECNTTVDDFEEYPEAEIELKNTPPQFPSAPQRRGDTLPPRPNQHTYGND